MPKVSVIIPTYNRCNLVLETLESVFQQTYKDFEVIVVNDGSTDDTGRVLQPLAEQGKIQYFEQPNAGQATARNRGLAEARGEFVAFLDDDDLWRPDKLEWQVNTLCHGSSKNFVAVYGTAERFYGSGPFSPNASKSPETCIIGVEITLKNLQRGNSILSPGQTLIRRTALLEMGGFDDSIWGAEDYDLYLRLARIGQFLSVPRVSLFYRVHPENTSNDYRRMYRNIVQVRTKNLGRFPGYRQWLVWWQNWATARRSVGKRALRCACTHLRGNRVREASRALAFSLWLWPSLITSRSLTSALAHSLARAYNSRLSRFRRRT